MRAVMGRPARPALRCLAPIVSPVGHDAVRAGASGHKLSCRPRTPKELVHQDAQPAARAPKAQGARKVLLPKAQRALIDLFQEIACLFRRLHRCQQPRVSVLGGAQRMHGPAHSEARRSPAVPARLHRRVWRAAGWQPPAAPARPLVAPGGYCGCTSPAARTAVLRVLPYSGGMRVVYLVAAPLAAARACKPLQAPVRAHVPGGVDVPILCATG